MKKKAWVLYLLTCRGGRLYTGISNDLEGRLRAHREGRGSKFVRAFSPFRLAGVVSCKDGTEARKLECRVKKMRRAGKLEFVASLKKAGTEKGQGRRRAGKDQKSGKELRS